MPQHTILWDYKVVKEMTLACNISEKIIGSPYGRLQCDTGRVMKIRGHSQAGWALFIEKKREHSF